MKNKTKQFVINNKNLMNEWDYEKNTKLNPSVISYGSDKKAWWICEKCGNNWSASIYHRATSGSKCPKCSKRKAGKIFLIDTYPELLREWDYEKNKELNINKITIGSQKKIWWKCINGHSNCTTLTNKIRYRNCPFCIGMKASHDYNLTLTNKDLCLEWNYDKNISLYPVDFTPYSNSKVWWICQDGHEWEAKISNRVLGNGCPICKKGQKTSFPEQALFFYVKKHFCDAINSYQFIYLDNKYEFDIYIPSINTAIEYDGRAFHNNDNRYEHDNNKNLVALNNDIRLIRIRENGLKFEFSNTCEIIPSAFTNDYESLRNVINVLLVNYLDVKMMIDINIEENRFEIWNNYLSLIDKDSLGNLRPDLLHEWNYEKNKNLSPYKVRLYSAKKVWWKCKKCDYEWQTEISNRTFNNNGCLNCLGKLANPQKNLAIDNPLLSSQWNHARNHDLLPNHVLKNSSKIVWWKCKFGHEWEASISNRNSNNHKCPYCRGKLATKENNLLIHNPALSKEWNYDKNSGLTPDSLLPFSSKKVWWKCSTCNYEWSATVRNRNKNNTNCPNCYNHKISSSIYPTNINHHK